MAGWIKLHRKFLNWEWFDDPNMIKLFIYLLLSANHERGKWQGHIIERGQLITGLNTLHKETKISKQTIRTCLSKLKKTKEINTHTNTRYTLITICNYDNYQTNNTEANTPTNTPLTHDQHTTNTPLTTNKNNKEIKNKKNNKEVEEKKITTAAQILNILNNISKDEMDEKIELTMFTGNIEELKKKFAIDFISRYGIGKTETEVKEIFQSWMHRDKNYTKQDQETQYPKFELLRKYGGMKA